jgi:hypothetical protein
MNGRDNDVQKLVDALNYVRDQTALCFRHGGLHAKKLMLNLRLTIFTFADTDPPYTHRYRN